MRWLFLLLGSVALAQAVATPGWVRLVPPVVKDTAAYLTLENRGKLPLRLVGAETDVAERVSFHQDHREHRGGQVVLGMLEDVRVEEAPAAVRVEDSPGATIRGLKARGLGGSPGVLVYSSPKARVEGSHLQGFMDGIYVEYSPGMGIRGNLLERNGRYGFHVMFSWQVGIEGNLSRNNGVGNAVMHGAQNLVRENRLYGHKSPVGYGLLVQEERGTEVRENLFVENTLGLVLMDAQGVRVGGNGFRENGTALRITRERGGNSAWVEKNAFQGNLYDLAVDDPEAKARVVGNLYDRASGLPVPHLPTGSFALLLARQPELSLFALSPGIVLWEAAEAQVPGLRLVALADARAASLPKAVAFRGHWIILGLLGGVLWWWRRT